MKRIMVTGAGGAPGLNFIQSLKEAPEPFYIVATDINEYHLQWLDVNRKYLVPPCDHQEYIPVLNSIIEDEDIEFVHPQPDVEVRVLSDCREQLKARTFLPARQTINILQDKLLSASLWKDAGIYQNITLTIETLEDLERAFDEIGSPLWMRARDGAGAKGSTLVENIETGWHWLSYWRARGIDWEFIVQEYLPGRDYGFQSLWKNGEVVTSQARERIEYIYPHLAPSGRTGTPIVATTVHNEALNKISLACVKAVDPNATGIFCVDLREDSKGHPIPTEINCGRFFTTSLFFTRAGLNMPYYYVKMGYGEELPLLETLNPLPKGLHWLRHVDCPSVLVTDETMEYVSRLSVSQR